MKNNYTLPLDTMSGEEIKVRMIELENEHKALTIKVNAMLDDMESIGKTYMEAKVELKKRHII